MSSIVIDLQNEITASECDVVKILRRAHVIAVKLSLKEFDQWISYELNGYPNQDTCPDYRKVRGVLKAFNPYHGWIPTLIPDGELEKMICEKRVPNSISEIITLCKTAENGLISEFSGEQLELFNRMFDSPLPMRYALHISGASVMDIVEKVKNTILEWTLKLEEEGVLGEGMRFSDEEKQTAKNLPQTVNNYYGATNVINGPSEGMQIVSGNENVTFSYDKASTAVSEIETAISQEPLQIEDKDAALEMLSEIRDKISQEKKPSVIKALLVGLKDFLINAGGSLAAGLIQAKIQGLF
ncbi:MAG: ABC transporter substrate-binding protein [Oscillospiraceae bacterium]|nr:ABC transporter substrate-binding protein [Oscillospiraceae bacterium]